MVRFTFGTQSCAVISPTMTYFSTGSFNGDAEVRALDVDQLGNIAYGGLHWTADNLTQAVYIGYYDNVAGGTWIYDLGIPGVTVDDVTGIVLADSQILILTFELAVIKMDLLGNIIFAA